MNCRLIALMLVPCLGYISYVLLILSELYRQKKYAHHIVLQDAALAFLYGPNLDAVKERKWFNLRMLLMWIVVGGMLSVCYSFSREVDSVLGFDFFDFIVGVYLTAILLAIAATLWSLLVFKFAAEEPSSITGQAVLCNQLVVRQNFYQMISFSLLLVGLAAYQPSSFLVGSALVSVMIAVNSWRRIGSMKNS